MQVNNTDAEGRLTLADALVYACNQGVDKVSHWFFLNLLIREAKSRLFLLKNVK